MSESSAEERYHVDRVAVGLALAGAALMVISVFLPRVESSTFGKVAKNTLIQSGDGWAFIVLGIVVAATVHRATQEGTRPWGPLICGLIVIGLAIYDGSGERLDLTGSSFAGGPLSERANAGIGIYAAGAGGLLSFIAGYVIRRSSDTVRAQHKQCPDCAETVLANAHICRYCGHRFPGFADSPERPDSAAASR